MHSSQLLLLLLLCVALPPYASSTIRTFDWKVQYTSVTRLCHTKSLVSINGQFPGPTAYVTEGDTVIVNVTNLVSYNVTIHWHGVRQLRSSWADGPAYITQCPLQTGKSYVHRFQIIGQRGTLFWHAHISWLRATLHGGFIIRPSKSITPPFSVPTDEIPIILGEWWNANVEDVIAQALKAGGGYKISDALTINGQPGFRYNCSQEGTQVFNITKGRKYLLRIINAAVNFQLYVAVAGHSLRVVEVDAEYTKPYDTDVVLVAPGQTTNVLLTANQSVGQYVIAASVYSPGPIANIPFPGTPTTAILSYEGAPNSSFSSLTLPSFPVYNDTTFALNFLQSLRGQPFSEDFFYYDIPKTIDEDLLFTVGYAVKPCPAGRTCQGPSGNLTAAAVSNISFSQPTTSILQAYYKNVTGAYQSDYSNITGVYRSDFPNKPLYQYDYTRVDPTNKFSVLATKVKVLEFNSNVQIVFQDTATLNFESHPIHLHGQNFYIVGSGNGTYNLKRDPSSFNLVDPTSRNTVAVPAGGWAAVRFRTTNPGAWYLHCHLDIHNSWGMAMVFIVKNGAKELETLPSPPSDLPPC